MLLTESFVAGAPCVKVTVPSGMPGVEISLNLQVDCMGQYEILIPAHVARNINYAPGFALAAVRMLDGTYRSARRGIIDVTAPWLPGGISKFSLRVLLAFNVVNHPPRINGFVGEDFFKKCGLIPQIDYAKSEITLLR